MKPTDTKPTTVRPSQREEVLEGIAQEAQLLAKLEVEQANARTRLAALRAELASRGIEPAIRANLPPTAEAQVQRTPAEKVALFRSLFIGYARGEAPLGYAEPGHEVVVEYDEGALRSLAQLEVFA